MLRVVTFTLCLFLLTGCTVTSLNGWLEQRIHSFSLLLPEPAITDAVHSLDELVAQKDWLTVVQQLARLEQEARLTQQQEELQIVTMNLLLQQADEDFASGRVNEAGRAYRIAKESLPQRQTVTDRLHLQPQEISARIDACADELLEQGLAVYRRGKLEHAVNIWAEISAFHPEHGPSQRAIRTTRQQLENLDRLPSG